MIRFFSFFPFCIDRLCNSRHLIKGKFSSTFHRNFPTEFLQQQKLFGRHISFLVDGQLFTLFRYCIHYIITAVLLFKLFIQLNLIVSLFYSEREEGKQNNKNNNNDDIHNEAECAACHYLRLQTIRNGKKTKLANAARERWSCLRT